MKSINVLPRGLKLMIGAGSRVNIGMLRPCCSFVKSLY